MSQRCLACNGPAPLDGSLFFIDEEGEAAVCFHCADSLFPELVDSMRDGCPICIAGGHHN
jgi:hypothetical protein